MSFFNKTSKSKVVAVIDITSSSVGGALIEINKNRPINILTALIKKPVNFLFDVNFDASLRCTIDSLRFVTKELRNFYSGRIDQVLCVFSSPWFISQTKMVSVIKEKSFEIKKDFFSKLIEEEEKKFSDNKKTNSQFIEHVILKTELNGYYTKSPVGKIARSVKSHIYLSAGVKKAIESAEKEIIKVFGPVSLKFATSPLVTFKVLNDIINNKEGFLIINIEGETTEINIIRHNTLKQSASFPRGSNLLFRKMALNLNTFLRETPSILRTYARGHRTMESSDKIALAIKDSIKEWRDYFEKSLAAMSQESLLPQNIFLAGDDLIYKFFSPCVEKSDFSEFAILREPFAARKINPGWMMRYFDSTNFSRYNKDVMFMIESIYADKFN